MREVPFPQWVPPEVMVQAKEMSEEEALSALGPLDSAVKPVF